MCIFQEQRIVFTVKYSHKNICKSPHKSNHRNFYNHNTVQTPAKKFFYIITLSLSIALTDQWLNSLCHTIKDTHSYNRHICNNSIGSNTDTSCNTKDKIVKYQCNNRWRNLPYKRWYPQLTAGNQMLRRKFLPSETNMALFSQIMGSTYRHCHKRA